MESPTSRRPVTSVEGHNWSEATTQGESRGNQQQTQALTPSVSLNAFWGSPLVEPSGKPKTGSSSDVAPADRPHGKRSGMWVWMFVALKQP